MGLAKKTARVTRAVGVDARARDFVKRRRFERFRMVTFVKRCKSYGNKQLPFDTSGGGDEDEGFVFWGSYWR